MESYDFVTVQATVRKSKVAAFYAMVSKLNAETEEVTTEGESTERARLRRWEPLPPEEEDSARRAAIVIYGQVSPRARETLNQLLDYNARLSQAEQFYAPPERVPVHGHDLAEALDLSLPGLAGTLKSLGVQSKAVGWENPVRSRPHREHGGHYWLDDDADQFFRPARSQFEREQRERERVALMRDLHLFGQFCDHEIDRLERELAELGNGDDSPSFAEQHAMLFAAREEQVARRREGADQLSRMSRDQDYRPPAKWQTIFQQREMKGQER